MQTCCCCCSLRTGCLVIATLNVICSIFGIAYYAYLISQQGIKPEYIAVLIVSAVVLIAAILLIQGVRKRRPGLMTTWIVIMVIETVLNIGGAVLFVLQLTGVIAMDGGKNTMTKTAELVGTVLGTLLLIYFLAVVRNYSRQLREENQGNPAVGYHVPNTYMEKDNRV